MPPPSPTPDAAAPDGAPAEGGAGLGDLVQRQRRLQRQGRLLPEGSDGRADRSGHLHHSHVHRRRLRQQLRVLRLLGGAEPGPDGVARARLRARPTTRPPWSPSDASASDPHRRAKGTYRNDHESELRAPPSFRGLSSASRRSSARRSPPGDARAAAAPRRAAPAPASPAAPRPRATHRARVPTTRPRKQQAQIDELVARSKDQDAQIAALREQAATASDDASTLQSPPLVLGLLRPELRRHGLRQRPRALQGADARRSSPSSRAGSTSTPRAR